MIFHIALLLTILVPLETDATPANPTPNPTQRPEGECPITVSRPIWNPSETYFAIDMESTESWYTAQDCCNSAWATLAIIPSTGNNGDTDTSQQSARYYEMYAECFSIAGDEEDNCWFGLRSPAVQAEQFFWIDGNPLVDEFWEKGASDCASGGGCSNLCCQMATFDGANDIASWVPAICAGDVWHSCDNWSPPQAGGLNPGDCTEHWTYGAQYAVCSNNVVWPNGMKMLGGDGFIQFGEFRLGMVDSAHLSISSSHGKTGQIFKSDGSGPRYDYTTYGTWGKSLGSMGAFNVIYNSHGIIFDNTWCIGSAGVNHLSVSHIDGQTSTIWRYDGTEHHGPRTDWNCFTSNYPNTITSDGTSYIQFNEEWRIGVVDSRLSVSHFSGKTVIAYKTDGTAVKNTESYFPPNWTRAPTQSPIQGGQNVQPKPEPEPQPIHHYDPQEPLPLPPNEPYTITLTTAVIASLLALALIANVVFLGYINCCSSTSKRRNGYQSVKYVDSESFEDSEAPGILQ